MALEAGHQLGDYKILKRIGAGGMGTVYLAENIHHRKRYAVKVLPESLAKDRDFVARFWDEARVMSELRHDHIVQVHHAGEQESTYYLVMDYVPGPEGEALSLHEYVRSREGGRLAETEARRWAVQIAEALAYAHERGVVHRDLKPGNVLIDASGNVKLTDFGLAKAVGEEFIQSQVHESMRHTLSPLDTMLAAGRRVEDTLDGRETVPAEDRSSSASSLLGTYDYMAPEQRGEGGEIGPWTDVYAFGVLLHRVLTGKRPTGYAKPPSREVAGLSKRWDAITAKCLADEPENRYESGEGLLRELRRVGRRSRWPFVAASAVGLVVAASAVLLLLNLFDLDVSRQDAGLPVQPDAETAPGNHARSPIADALQGPETPEATQPRYQSLLVEAQAAEKRGDWAAAETAAKKALNVVPNAPEAQALLERLTPTLLVQAEVDERPYRGAEVRVNGLLQESRTPARLRMERGRTYEVEVSVPGSKWKQYGKASQTIRADEPGVQTWTASLKEVEFKVPSWAMVSEFQIREARKAGVPVAKEVDLGGGVLMRFVYIPPGTFQMGSRTTPAEDARRYGATPERYEYEHPLHRVTLTEGFYMGITEVTQAQWRAVMRSEPWRGKDFSKAGDENAASYISWDDAAAFCEALSRKAKGTVRLPTEAEWEYACRAGATTAYCFGDDIAVLSNYAWYGVNPGRGGDGSGGARDPGKALQDFFGVWPPERKDPGTALRRFFGPSWGDGRESREAPGGSSPGVSRTPSSTSPHGFGTHTVGVKRPNAWGLYDMHGNAWEWCADWYGKYASGSVTNPPGPTSGAYRVGRGGAWSTIAAGCRSAARGQLRLGSRNASSGVRVVLSPFSVD